ncbi:DnaD domain protein [Liquorilactobacillus hordei]|uniref:DnaD domain-containing protein n=1 Tax=Liquorilactobacillus hordei TaxID=468911 RepID=UPI0039E7859D
MAIIRQKRNSNFSIMSNEMLSDANMSFKARGLLAYMLSKPDDWKFYVSELSDHSDKDGEKAIRSALREIESAGYLERHRDRDNTGKFTGQDFILSDNPHSQNRHDANRPDEKRSDDKGRLLSTDNTKNLNKLNTDNKEVEEESNAFTAYQLTGATLTGFTQPIFSDYVQRLGDELVKHAIEVMSMQAQRPNFNYLQTILESYINGQIKTVDQAKKMEKKFKNKGTSKDTVSKKSKQGYNYFAGSDNPDAYDDVPF